MRIEDYDDDVPDEETVIDGVLGANPRASDLQLMIAALEQRRAAFKRQSERTTEASERTKLAAKLAELDTQIKALRDEEAITRFVEDSVRVTLHKTSLEDMEI